MHDCVAIIHSSFRILILVNKINANRKDTLPWPFHRMYKMPCFILLVFFSVLKKAFEAFDQEKKGCIGTVMVGTILGMLGHQVGDETLQEIIAEVDVDGWYLPVQKFRTLYPK